MGLRIRSLHRACYVVLLVLLLGRMYDNCELDNSGIKIVINKTCGWSDWLSWSCTCCSKNSTRPFAVRKRAICCSGSTTVEQCIKECGYADHSDTMYGNCSTDNCGDISSEGGKCGETSPPSNDLHLLSLPTKATATATSSSPTMSTSSSSTSSSSPTRSASTSSTTSLSSDLIMPTTYSSTTSSSSVLSMSTTSTATASSSNSLSILLHITHDSSVPVPSTRLTTLPTLNSSRHDSTTVSESDSYSIAHSTNHDTSAYSRQNVHTSTYVPRNETSEASNKFILTEANSHVGVILGAVLGSVVALGAVGALLYFLKRAKKTTKTAAVHPDSENQPTESDCELDTVNM